MKKLIITIFAAILFSIFCIIIKDNYENKLLNHAEYGLPRLINQGQVENLFIGSSMFRQGLDSKILEENGIDSYILSYNGNNPILESWIIDYLLKNNVKIKNLYIDLYAYSLADLSPISDSKILMEVNLKGKYELYNLLGDNKDFSDFYSIFVSKNVEQLLTWPIYYPIVNATYYQGGIKIGKNGIDKNKLDNLNIIEESTIKDKNIEAILNIIKICQENNISLSYIETPKSGRIMEDHYYQGLMAIYTNILKENNITYYLSTDINENISKNSYNFFDLIHLSNQGRKEYTESLTINILNKI